MLIKISARAATRSGRLRNYHWVVRSQESDNRDEAVLESGGMCFWIFCPTGEGRSEKYQGVSALWLCWLLSVRLCEVRIKLMGKGGRSANRLFWWAGLQGQYCNVLLSRAELLPYLAMMYLNMMLSMVYLLKVVRVTGVVLSFLRLLNKWLYCWCGLTRSNCYLNTMLCKLSYLLSIL